MSDNNSANASSPPPVAASEAIQTEAVKDSSVGEVATTNGTKTTEPKEAPVDDATVEDVVPDKTDKQPSENNNDAEDKPATTLEEPIIENKASPQEDSADAGEVTIPLNDTPAGSKNKSSGRRKSGGVPEHKRKLNKKGSKAKLTTHTDAQPGDYFFGRLKGYPLWPVIVCDEVMLPGTLLRTRPVTAAREDGSYRADYEDGGPKIKDRTFPVMYLHTNEFSWLPNYDLLDLDPTTVGETSSKMRKDLQEAHKLAAEQHDLDYFKTVLTNFMQQREEDIRAQAEADQAAKEAAEAAQAEKAAKALKPKTPKAKPAKTAANQDEDSEMLDVDVDTDGASASNKRKAEEDGTAAQSQEPSKKIKLSLKFGTPKAANGTTPKPSKDTPSTKSAKPKSKKATPKVTATPEAVIPKEPELSAEEKRAKKEKEILFLRHKLQKGLLTRDTPPKEEEMKQMSEFVSKLEGYSELEVSIIRATKINKVLKAILKLPSIPKEEEFKFKSRSQTLLDKWNKLLASEQPAVATNGTADLKDEAEETKPSPPDNINGAKDAEAKAEETKESAVESPPAEDEKHEVAKNEVAAPAEIASIPSSEKPIESVSAVDESTA